MSADPGDQVEISGYFWGNSRKPRVYLTRMVNGRRQRKAAKLVKSFMYPESGISYLAFTVPDVPRETWRIEVKIAGSGHNLLVPGFVVGDR